MLKLISLALPVLIPSWRFFKAIEPSPRVQWSLLPPATLAPGPWQDVQPRPQRVPISQMLRRLLWNPAWNESLYLVSCAERIQQQRDRHSIDEIRCRVLRMIRRSDPNLKGAFRFRLVFVRRDGADLVEEIVFISDSVPLSPRQKP